SNAPFAAEVQSNIEQSCCSIIAKAGKNLVLGSEAQDSRLFRTETEFVKLPVPLDIGSRSRSILMPCGRRPSTGLAQRSRYVSMSLLAPMFWRLVKKDQWRDATKATSAFPQTSTCAMHSFAVFLSQNLS